VGYWAYLSRFDSIGDPLRVGLGMGSPTYQTGDENPSLAAADGGRLVKLSSWKSATQPPTPPPLFRHPMAVSPQRAVLFAFLPTTASMDPMDGMAAIPRPAKWTAKRWQVVATNQTPA